MVGGAPQVPLGGGVQGGDGAFVESVLLGEALQEEPEPGRRFETALHFLGLEVVGGEAEPDPGGGITLRLPRGTDIAQGCVVLAGVVLVRAEPLLDARELGGEDALARQDQGVDGAGHPAVTVAPGVDGDKVEVRHGGPYEGRGVQVPFGEPVDELAHQFGDLLGVRGGVDRWTARTAGDPDAAGAVLAGAHVAVDAPGDHEVQGREQGVVPGEDLEFRGVLDVGEGVAVADDGVTGGLVGLGEMSPPAIRVSASSELIV